MTTARVNSRASAPPSPLPDVPRDYSHLSREQLPEILQRRDLDAPYGLVWERDEIEPEANINRDYVGLRLDPALSCGPAPWKNLVVEGDNWELVRQQGRTGNDSVCAADLFSPSRLYRNCLRLNCGNPWSEAIEAAVKRLGDLAAGKA